MNEDNKTCPDCIEAIAAYREIEYLRNQLTKLQAIVDKLPKYNDIGESFVPGRDDAWITGYNSSQKGKNEKPDPIHNASSDSSCEWECAGDCWYVYWGDTHGQPEVETKFYSTREAAKAAKEGE